MKNSKREQSDNTIQNSVNIISAAYTAPLIAELYSKNQIKQDMDDLYFGEKRNLYAILMNVMGYHNIMLTFGDVQWLCQLFKKRIINLEAYIPRSVKEE